MDKQYINAQTGRPVQVIEIDPTELLPGDVVVKLSDREIGGCHCDVRVTVERRI